MISKSKLVPLLIEHGFIASEKKVTYEAYGKKVKAYVWTASAEERKKLEAFLSAKKIAFSPEYWPGSQVAEVSVSYFKAWHHDE